MIILILTLFNLLNAQEMDRRLFMPRSLALCGAMEARINLNESLYFNPASSAHSRLFSMDAGFGWQHNTQFPSRIGTYYVNAIDTDSDLLGGGVAYYRRNMGVFGSEWDLRGVVNKLLWKNRMSLGLGVNYTKFNHNGSNNKNFNVDFGFIFLLTSKTLLGGTAYNLFGDKYNVKTRSIDIAIRHTMWDFFSATLDYEQYLSKRATLTGALELLYKNGIMISSSLQRNFNLQNIYWGFGCGYVGPKISLLYGTMNAATAPYSFTHSFSVRVFF